MKSRIKCSENLEEIMNNPTLDTIHQHASIRHYKPDPLPVSLVETIVEAGQRASSSYNLQAYSVIAVTEE